MLYACVCVMDDDVDYFTPGISIPLASSELSVACKWYFNMCLWLPNSSSYWKVQCCYMVASVYFKLAQRWTISSVSVGLLKEKPFAMLSEANLF